MIQMVRQPVDVTVDESDLISPTDAANMSGRNLSTILSMMAQDTLPIFILPGDKRIRAQRFTSRKAVEAMPKEKRTWKNKPAPKSRAK